MNGTPKSSLAVALSVVVLGGCLVAGCNRDSVRQPEGGLRTQWGEPDLMGVWQGPKLGATTGQDSLNLAQLESLYRSEARAKMTQISAGDDPALRCVPAAFPRAAVLGWPIQIMQRPGMMLIVTEAFHTFRYVPTDGRGHDANSEYQFPTFVGHSAGKWEGDTLTVDVMHFRQPWLAGSQDKPTSASTGVWPTSEGLRVIERWRRVDADTLEYQARVEDSTMLTAAWETPKISLKRQPLDVIEEVKCLVDDPETRAASYLAQFGR